MKCPKCGFDNPSNFKFCGNCGTSLIEKEIPCMPVELKKKIDFERERLKGARKKVAVMFADVSGFTSLCEKLDPEEVTNLMNNLFERFGEIIYRYEGYIDKYIGDCVMALFGAPISHEDDALRAVLCAIDMMSEVKQFEGLSLSIGINFGEVVAGGVGSHHKLQYTVMGDTVNLAQRLQSVAGAGEIYVSEKIYELTKSEIEYEKLPPLKLKGKSYLITAFKPVKVKAKHMLRRIKEIPMIGRDKEMEILLKLYEDVKRGESRVVSITGEAGIGKSKLANEFVNKILEDKITLIETRGIDYLKNAELWTLKDFLRKLIKIEEKDPSAISQKIESFIKKYNQPEILTRILKWMLGGEISEIEKRSIEQIEKDNRNYILFRGLSLILKNIAKFPLILIFDDVQWIDINTREFLSFLIKSIEKSKIMLILIQRPYSDYILPELEHCVKISLQPLEKKEVEKLASAIIKSNKIDEKLEKILIERSEGNPFYLEEFVTMLLNRNLIDIEGNVAKLKGEIKNIPIKLEELILAKVDKLDDESKYILELASVIGHEFSTKLLENLTEYAINIKSVLKNIENKGLIENITKDLSKILEGDEEYAFKHIIIRDVIYNTILKSLRKDYHRKVANAIENIYKDNIENYYELLIHHFKIGEEKEKYMKYLLKFGEKMSKEGNYKKAEELYEEWMRNYGNLHAGEEGISNLIKLMGIKTKLAKYREVEEIFEKIERDYKDLLKDDILIEFLLEKSWFEGETGKYDKMLETGKECLRLIEKSKHNEETKSNCLNNIGRAYRLKGEYKKAIECYEKALEIRLKITGENHPDTATIYNNIGEAYYYKGEYDRAIEFYKKAVKIRAQTLGEMHPDIATSYNDIGMAYFYKGEYDKAIECYKKAVKIRIHTLGEMHPYTASSYNNIGVAYYGKGEHDKSIEYYQKALKIRLKTLGETHTAICYNNIGEAYHCKGEYDKAIEYREKAREIWEKVLGEAHPYTSNAYYGLGKTYFALKDYEKALKYMQKALEIREEKMKGHSDTGEAYFTFGKILVELGRKEEAKQNLKKALEIFMKHKLKDRIKEVEEILKNIL